MLPTIVAYNYAMLPTIVAYILMGAGCLALFALTAMVHISKGHEELEIRLGFMPAALAICASIVAVAIAPFMISNAHGLSFLGSVFLIFIYLISFKIWQTRRIKKRLEKQEKEKQEKEWFSQRAEYAIYRNAQHRKVIELRNLEIRANTDTDSIWHGIE